MFERFSSRARSVLVFAQDEARQLRHNYIGTEHLVLGIVQCGDEVVTHFLSGYDFTLEDLREQVTELIGPGSADDVLGPPPFTARAKKVLELSLREALAMGHDHIGPAHILIGVLREGEGVGAKLLNDLGVDYDRTRLWVGQQVGESRTVIRGRRGKRVRTRDIGRLEWDSGTSPAVRAWSRALAFAGHEQLGTHHVLLGLLNEPASLAGKVLEALDVTKLKAEAKIAEIGVEGTTDAPRPKPAKPLSVKLADGVEVRITDPQLSALVEGGEVEELLKEIVRRSKS